MMSVTFAVSSFVESCKAVLLPSFFGVETPMESSLQTIQRSLSSLILRFYGPDKSEVIPLTFLPSLPNIQEIVVDDAATAVAKSASPAHVVVLTSQALHALIGYRIAHRLYELQCPAVALMISSHVQRTAHIEIHPSATIGRGVYIHNGTGLVIGAGVTVDNNAFLESGVTLVGDTPSSAPYIKTGAIVRSHSTIWGPVTVGRGSHVGGNVWVTEDVDAEACVTQAAPVMQVEIRPRANI